MQVEELLALLKDKGLGDEEISALLEEALKQLAPIEQPQEQVEEARPEEEEIDDEEKMKAVFGI